MDQDVESLREQERLYNFLKKYDLHQYYQKLTVKGVHRLSHLKAVLGDEASLDEIGLSRIERVRLRKKVKENVAWRGRIVVSEVWLSGPRGGGQACMLERLIVLNRRVSPLCTPRPCSLQSL